MKSADFEYDGILLSEKGYIMCNFNTDGISTVSGGSHITMNTIRKQHGVINDLISADYDEILSTTFQICKFPCGMDAQEDQYLTMEEVRDMTRWLNRKEFLKFRFMDDELMNIYYEGTFNINTIKFHNHIIGLELTLITNKPFAFGKEKTITITNATANGTYTLKDESDEIGYIYPKMVITCSSSGNLTIHNAIEDRSMVIKNCTSGEVITVDYPVISSSLVAHAILNDFNWSFFRIANVFNNVKNVLTISLPCTIVLTYSPIIKVGI